MPATRLRRAGRAWSLYLRLIGELDADGKHLLRSNFRDRPDRSEDARVLMPEQGADILAHFGEDHFLERYQRYKAHIAEWRQQYPQACGGGSALREAGGAADDVGHGRRAGDAERERGG